jgi:hypothetical protein
MFAAMRDFTKIVVVVVDVMNSNLDIGCRKRAFDS